jgi:hypothetical protein
VVIVFFRKHQYRVKLKAINGGTSPRPNLAKVKMCSLSLLAIVTVIIGITLFLPIVTAQNSESNYFNGDYWSAEGPIATVHWTNGTANQLFEITEDHTSIFLTDTTNSTLRIHVDGPKEISYNQGNRDTLRCSMEYLTAVSYQASWENNKATQVYTNTTDNKTKTYDFELTNIPYGNNTIELYASYLVSACGPPLYSSLHMSTHTNYFFVVSPNTQVPTPTPTTLVSDYFGLEEIILFTLLIIVIVVVLVTYKRKRHVNPPWASTGSAVT